ncbi:MAG: hypothetical protein GC168_15705 [Candidatus Hydrogenedens sp.]|nr:hypothetical protein [Candidatus Hydrogenedens sp.]
MTRIIASRAALLLLTAALLLTEAAFASNPALSTILPRGGQRGTEQVVTFHGGRLSDAVDVYFHSPGITASDIAVQDDGHVNVKFTIAPDCPVGPQLVRMRTRTGITSAVVFSVGNLPQHNETEPNSRLDEAEALALNSTVEGVIPSEDVDYYSFDLKTGDRLAVEVEAIRLGGMLFDPKLRLFGPEGHERVSEDDTAMMLQDAAFVYTAIEDGTHRLAVSEASYGGGGSAYYRLHVGTFPRPLMESPLGGKPASDLEVRWIGDPALAAQTVTTPGPAMAPVPAVDGIDPAAILIPDNYTQPIVMASDTGVAPTQLNIRTVDVPVTAEVEPNNELAAATLAPAPGAFEGVIQEPGDVDVFAVEGLPHGNYDVRVWARELGSPLDSVLNVYKPDNSGLGGNDDAVGADSVFRATIDQDGRYTIRVTDHLSRGGEKFAYRIEMLPVKPKLQMSVLNNRPGNVTIHDGASNFILVSAGRQDFNEEVRLVLEGLPEGVTAEYDPIPTGGTSTPIYFTAAPEAPVAQSALRILGLGQTGEQWTAGDLNQEIRLITGNNDTTFYAMQADRLALAVADAPPFRVHIVPPQAPFVHGTGRALKVEVERNEGFADEIALSFPWLPGGLKGGTAKIPGDQNSVDIWMEAAGAAGEQTHQIFVQAESAGYTFCSPKVPLETQAQWLAFNVPAIETELGKNTELVVTVEQRTAWEGTFNAQLISLPRGITSEPQPMTKDTTELNFPITVAADAPVGKHERIAGDVYIEVNGEPVRQASGSGQITVYEPLPAELQAQAAPEAKADEPKPDEPERKTRFPKS